jgi:hypothetical protein
MDHCIAFLGRYVPRDYGMEREVQVSCPQSCHLARRSTVELCLQAADGRSRNAKPRSHRSRFLTTLSRMSNEESSVGRPKSKSRHIFHKELLDLLSVGIAIINDHGRDLVDA